ncbi:MGMT family protein [Sulfuriflexus mobilis]|uniref:MGMT family protein n=1 Tax=Sulfuriflexus mobilis TaxID=1811807 RepID=UPI0018D58C21|nr:MGMT family protein [Sulfuriflexus mobilis]
MSYEDIYAMVRRVPRGRVATYGQIARLVNRPRGARQIGYALAALARATSEAQVPWHRVVNARGEVSPRTKAGYEEFQRILLEDEGVTFDLNGRINLARFLWRPRDRNTTVPD